MRRAAAVALIAACVVGTAAFAGSTPALAASGPATLTPVVVTVADDVPVTPVVGTDSVLHVVYELQVVNTQSQPVTIESVEVESVDPKVRYGDFEGDELAARLRHLDGAPAGATVLEPGGQRFLLVDVALPSIGKRTKALQHRVTVDDHAFTTAPLVLQKRAPAVLAPPVSGSSWVVTDGCCRPETPYRTAILSTS
ncbi:MAG TPA: hypothetical protein VFZ17_01645, partial [Acidimicrobiia bacterium]|nr:hypothetical protein [Acidimicrobiia bacterium]